MNDEDRPSRLWLIGPPLSLALLALTLYVKYLDVRAFVDGHCPWIKNTVGRYVPAFPVAASPVPSADATHPASGVSATTTPPPKPFDLPTVCADSNRWPKTVTLKKVVEFPGVFRGKVVGKVYASPGCEARVVAVKDGKIGVEYRGGGVWLEFENTDFVERARQMWR